MFCTRAFGTTRLSRFDFSINAGVCYWTMTTVIITNDSKIVFSFLIIFTELLLSLGCMFRFLPSRLFPLCLKWLGFRGAVCGVIDNRVGRPMLCKPLYSATKLHRFFIYATSFHSLSYLRLSICFADREKAGIFLTNTIGRKVTGRNKRKYDKCLNRVKQDTSTSLDSTNFSTL